MHWSMITFLVVLFYVLTPGIFLRLPPGGSKTIVALTHGLVFALVYYFTHHSVAAFFHYREGVDKTLKKKHMIEKKPSSGAYGSDPAKSQ
jgi:phosphotransferase system  glucose/maltose/N-acetylglucosamine-specific IIC component